MNTQEHIFIGIISFLGYSYFIDLISTSAHVPWIYGLIVVIVGSIIPDILEPATHWRHRDICHSIGTLMSMALLFGITAIIAIIISFFSNFSIFYLASCFFLGYLFHLLADSITPAGLPN
jgi:membrane-bound metal-dependent hydrolase YbcI (DUF457 family)